MADPSDVWTGGCLCGAVRYRATGTPEFPHICHCRMCQLAVGGPFAALVRFPLAGFEWTGAEPKRFRSSPVADRGFCPDCGTSLTFERTDPKRTGISVTMASLDRAEAITPEMHIGIESRLPWPRIDDGLKAIRTDEFPGYVAF